MTQPAPKKYVRKEVVKKADRHFDTGEALCRFVRERHGDTVLLPFSAGKDSVGAWLQLRRFFTRIIPVYLYYVPGIEFVEDNLAYYERYFGQRIMRLPEGSLYLALDNLLFQPPERVKALRHARFLRNWSNGMALDAVRTFHGLPKLYSGDGIRMSDSMRRRFSIQKHGSIYPDKRRFFPCFDWSDARLEEEIRREGVKLASDYHHFYRTFEGGRYAQLCRIKEAFPRDYERILQWLPLAEAELLRRKWAPPESQQ